MSKFTNFVDVQCVSLVPRPPMFLPLHSHNQQKVKGGSAENEAGNEATVCHNVPYLVV